MSSLSKTVNTHSKVYLKHGYWRAKFDETKLHLQKVRYKFIKWRLVSVAWSWSRVVWLLP